MVDVLNLDELFGQAQPIAAKWDGKEYSLRRPEAFGPREAVQFDHASKLYAELRQKSEKLIGDDASAQQFEEVVNTLIAMMNPKLAETDMPFFARIKVFDYYCSKIAPDDESKNVGAEPQ